MNNFKNFLKYFDTFGIKSHFYIDKRPRYYSIKGGILSFFSFFICLGIFILISLKRINFSITTIISSNSKINIDKNKIFLPLKISNDNNIFTNISSVFQNNKQLINCKLCNETSMININKMNEEYKKLLPILTELYCIDLGELFNNKESLISNNIILDLYIYNMDINLIKLELFYPIIEFHPNNFLEPLLNIYINHSIYLRKDAIAKESIVLGEYSVLDKYGFFGNKEKLLSYWGTNNIYSEYINVNNTDNVSTAIYRLNILFDLKKIKYKRYHVNIFNIFIDLFPICYIIFKFIRCILKPFILAESNSKIFELIFEKIVEKDDKREMFKKLRFKSLGEDAQYLKKKIVKNTYKGIKNNNYQNLSYLRKNKEGNINNSNNVDNLHQKNNIDHYNIKEVDRSSHKDFPIMKLSKGFRKKSRLSVDLNTHNIEAKNNNNLFLINQNILINKNINDNSMNLDGSRFEIIQDGILSQSHKHSKVRKGKLFPYKYFFFSTFLKNYEIFNCKYLFPIKYKKIFTFLNQLLDINSYFALKKEFEIMKHLYCNKEDLDIIERNKKINVNTSKFNREIKECIEKNNVYIFYNRAK